MQIWIAENKYWAAVERYDENSREAQAALAALRDARAARDAKAGSMSLAELHRAWLACAPGTDESHVAFEALGAALTPERVESEGWPVAAIDDTRTVRVPLAWVERYATVARRGKTEELVTKPSWPELVRVFRRVMTEECGESDTYGIWAHIRQWSIEDFCAWKAAFSGSAAAAECFSCLAGAAIHGSADSLAMAEVILDERKHMTLPSRCYDTHQGTKNTAVNRAIVRDRAKRVMARRAEGSAP